MRLLALWSALALAGVLAAVKMLRVETDIVSVLPPHAPEVIALRALRDHFEQHGELLAVVEAAAGENADSAAQAALDALRASSAVGEARLLGVTQDVHAAARPLAWVLMNLPPERLRALAERLTTSELLAAHLAAAIEAMASSPDVATVQRLSFDPLGLSAALDGDALAGALDAGDSAFDPASPLRLVRVLPREPARDYKQAGAFVAAVRQTLADRGVKAELTGEIAFMAEAGGTMERDLSSTISSSVAMIALLFWLMYRRIVPLLWIVTALAIVLGITAGIGALVLGEISAMNLGFAAIVIGLAVDYGVLIHVERRAGEAANLVRRRVARSILGAAVTTAAVFLVLMLSSFPGLRELGALVAIGVTTGAVVMLSLIPMSKPPHEAAPEHPSEDKPSPGKTSGTLLAQLGLGVVACSILVLFWKGLPGFDGTSAPLRPRNSEAMAAMERIEGSGTSAKAPLLLTAPDMAALRARAIEIVKDDRTWLPVAFLPDSEAQVSNRPWIEKIAHESGIEKGAADAGFTPESLLLFRAVASALSTALERPWPLALTDAPGADLITRFVATPGANASETKDRSTVAVLGWTASPSPPSGPDIHLPQWERLGPALSAIAREDALRKMLPLCLILIGVLFGVLRRWQDVLLGIASLAAGFLIWFAVMSLTSQQWNLASIAAIPLLLGTGIDYSIHMLLALQREGGDAHRARAVTGRAVIFCALSTCVGFGSLLLATNGALSSLGAACAAGLGVMMIVAVGFLPEWRRRN